MKTLAALLALMAQEWEHSFDAADPETRLRAVSIQRLRDEVSALNLVNGLYLTRGQSGKIIELAREAGTARDAAIRRHAGLLREFEAALAELKTHLAACGHIPPEVEKRVQGAEGAINSARRAYLDRLRDIEKRLCAVLTPAQKSVIESFNPCIIPPQDLKDPVRVGQARSETYELEEHLETIRNLPDKAWKPVAGALFEVYLSFEENILGSFTPEKRKAETDRLMELAVKIRAMTDEDFEYGKGDLALEVIRPIHEHQEKAQELTHHFIEVSGGLKKPGKYLLDPRIIPLLKAKLRHECPTPDVDLDRIPAAACASCGDAAGNGPPRTERLGPEPRFAEFADWLGLSGESAEKAREAIAEAQIDLLTTLAADREDGRNVLSEFLKKLLAKKEAEAFALLGLKVPGAEKTYFERLAEIKARADFKLAAVLGIEKFEKYRVAGVDLFKIKAGSLRCRKD